MSNMAVRWHSAEKYSTHRVVFISLTDSLFIARTNAELYHIMINPYNNATVKKILFETIILHIYAVEQAVKTLKNEAF